MAIRKILLTLGARLQRALSALQRCFLGFFENTFLKFRGHRADLEPPLFVIGPPRSGSTLIVQALTNAFDVGYMSNLHCRWHGWPGLVERVFRSSRKRSPISYRSNLGRTHGLYAPAECGAWWYRFFPKEPPYVALDDISERRLRAFRNSLCDLQAAIGLPLFLKNLYASLRIEPIVSCFPNALFVVVERSEFENAHSILKARYAEYGNYSQWFSVPPPDVEELEKLPPVEQVVGQIRSIHALIKQDTARLGLEERVFRISYEAFCSDVNGTLNDFQSFMGRHGVALPRRFDVPESFSTELTRGISEEMFKDLKACAAKGPAGDSL